jgi:hypothetical protein
MGAGMTMPVKWLPMGHTTGGSFRQGKGLSWASCLGTETISPCKGKKVNLSLCFNWAPRHEGVLGEWRYSSTHSLTSAIDGGEWSASRPGRFTLRGRAPGTHWIGGWVGPRAVLDAVVKRKIPSPRRKSNPRAPIIQPVAKRYTDWAITYRYIFCKAIHTFTGKLA